MQVDRPIVTAGLVEIRATIPIVADLPPGKSTSLDEKAKLLVNRSVTDERSVPSVGGLADSGRDHKKRQNGSQPSGSIRSHSASSTFTSRFSTRFGTLRTCRFTLLVLRPASDSNLRTPLEPPLH